MFRQNACGQSATAFPEIGEHGTTTLRSRDRITYGRFRARANGLGISVRIWRVILALPMLTLMSALGGCGWMSVSGPAATDILAGQRDPASLNYAVVKVTPKVVGVLAKNLPRLATFVSNQRPRDITFGVGDILTITILEAASGGLFIP